MKLHRIIISLLISALLCTTLFAQEAKQQKRPPQHNRAELKAYREQHMRDKQKRTGKADRKKKIYGRKGALQKQLEQEKATKKKSE